MVDAEGRIYKVALVYDDPFLAVFSKKKKKKTHNQNQKAMLAFLNQRVASGLLHLHPVQLCFLGIYLMSF